MPARKPPNDYRPGAPLPAPELRLIKTGSMITAPNVLRSEPLKTEPIPMTTQYNGAAPAVNNPLAVTRRIPAESIARSHWNPQKRAALAADWLSGRFHIKPTAVLASRVFNVSVPLIRAALRRHQ
jgi:hypothetical protein